MLRRAPRAALLWAAAALVALVTTVYAADVLSSLRRQDQVFGRVRPVVVATRDLPMGTVVARSDVSTRRVRGESAELGALRDRALATGRVIAAPLLRGAVVTRRHLAAPGRNGTSGVVPEGLRAMRVVVDGGPRPRPGDPVDLYATFDPQILGDDAEPTLTVARAVPVLSVDDGDGTIGADGVEGGGSAVGVTVLVTPDEARRLAFSVATGALAMAIAPPEEARLQRR